MSTQEEKLSQQLSQKLLRDILHGAISPGQKLTSQRQLASEYQMSRTTVREAIQDLESKGLVETYHGGGSVCRNLLEPLFGLAEEHNPEDVDYQKQVMDIRAVLEGEAAFYTAIRATDQQLDVISKEYMATLPQNTCKTGLTKATADLNFHMAIAEASRNFFVMSFSQIFYNRYFNTTYPALSRMLKNLGNCQDNNTTQHSHIYHALISRDPVSAKKAAISHVSKTRQLLEKNQ